MSALLAFLGGSTFRMVWGEIAAFFTRRQEQQLELERMRLQGDLEEANHRHNIESIRMQSEMGVKVIEAQRSADIDRVTSQAWSVVAGGTAKLTGLKFVDYWNQSIRPALATMAIALVVLQVAQNGFVLTDWDKDLVAAILGIYVADRSLSKRGK